MLADRPRTWEDPASPDGAQFKPVTPLLPVDAFDTFLAIVATRGEEDLPRRSDKFISDENGRYALGVLRNLYDMGPDEQVEMNPIDVLGVLASEEEFFCSPCLFGYVNYSEPRFRTHRMECGDLPVSEGFDRPRSILGGAGIGISAKTEAPEEAIEFARWISSEPVQSSIYIANSGQPAHRETWVSLADDPDLAGFFSGAFRTMENAWTRPRDPWFLGFVCGVCAILPDFLWKNIPADRFLAELNALFRQHVKVN